MPWVEIINARISASTTPAEAQRFFRGIRRNLTVVNEEVRAVIHRGEWVEGDWAIHLYHEKEGPAPRRTWLGIKLAEEIRRIALVDHSVWIEQT